MALAFIVEFPEDDTVFFYHPTHDEDCKYPVSIYECDNHKFEAELQENTVGYALKLMGWVRETMPLEFAVDCSNTIEEGWHTQEGLQELLSRPVGLHPVAHFTIGEAITVDEPSEMDILTDQMSTFSTF
jgi:hypothetical protein